MSQDGVPRLSVQALHARHGLPRTSSRCQTGVFLLAKTDSGEMRLYSLSDLSLSQVVPRFNERFMLSLANCRSCLLMDDELNILPTSSHAKLLKPVESDGVEVR